jgi:transposase
VISPHLPKPCATGRPREWPMRESLNGIFYVVRAGCPWRLLPKDLPDLPPLKTIYRWFAAWRDGGATRSRWQIVNESGATPARRPRLLTARASGQVGL